MVLGDTISALFHNSLRFFCAMESTKLFLYSNFPSKLLSRNAIVNVKFTVNDSLLLLLQQYVQDLLKLNYEHVCELILLNGGHIYVCGDVSMAADVSKTLLNLFQEFAALSEVEAQELMAMLRVS